MEEKYTSFGGHSPSVARRRILRRTVLWSAPRRRHRRLALISLHLVSLRHAQREASVPFFQCPMRLCNCLKISIFEGAPTRWAPGNTLIILRIGGSSSWSSASAVRLSSLFVTLEGMDRRLFRVTEKEFNDKFRALMHKYSWNMRHGDSRESHWVAELDRGKTIEVSLRRGDGFKAMSLKHENMWEEYIAVH